MLKALFFILFGAFTMLLVLTYAWMHGLTQFPNPKTDIIDFVEKKVDWEKK